MMISANGVKDPKSLGDSGGSVAKFPTGLPSATASTSNVVSLGTVLSTVRRDLYHGVPPVEFAVANEPWGTLALRPGDILCIAAPPGMGKTALVSQMTVDAVRLSPAARVLTVNVEMTPQVLLERQLSRISGVPYADIASRQSLLGRQHMIEPAFRTLAAIGDRMFFMGPPFSIERVIEAVEETQPNILVCDYLQRFDCGGGVSDTRSRLNTLMHEVRILANAGISVVLVSAVARTQSKKGGGYSANELGMGSFRESSEIEYGCDDAFVLVEEGNAERSSGRKILNLRHVKSRNHRQHDLRLEFDGVLQRFKLLPAKAEDEAERPASGLVSPPKSTKSGVDPWSFGYPGSGSDGTPE